MAAAILADCSMILEKWDLGERVSGADRVLVLGLLTGMVRM
jgi:hypothetical protein